MGKARQRGQPRPAALTPDQAADAEELQKASRRIGRTPKAWMNWILKFARTELHGLSTGGWMDLGYEIALFTLVGPPEAMQVGRSIASRAHERETEGSPWLCRLPEPKEVAALQALADHHVEALITTRTTDFPPFQARMRVENDPRHDLGSLIVSPKTTRQSFLYGLARLLAIHAARLRRCPSCAMRFLANRRDQQYCSIRCLSRITMRRHRGTPPERFGKRGRPPKTANQRAQRARGPVQTRKER